MGGMGKGVLIFVSTLILLVIAGLLFLFFRFSDSVLPGGEKISRAKNELLQKQAELREKGTALAHKRNIRKQFAREAENFWIIKRDGKLEGALQKNIENAARNVKVTINSVGNSNLSRVNDQFSYSDLNLELVGPAEEISQFMVEIYKAKPRLYWTRCMIRPYKAEDSSQLALSATLRLVCIDDNSVASKILEMER